MENNWDRRFDRERLSLRCRANRISRLVAFRLKPCIKALSVADGEERNCFWLTEHGLEVVSIDISRSVLARELRASRVSLQTVLAKLAEWEWESESYDLVVYLRTIRAVRIGPDYVRRLPH